MSQTIDNRVVQMQFDNRHFEENVATSLSTLDKLKKSLNMDGAARGFNDINKAVGNVNMSGLGIAVDEVGLKFRAMYSIADQALRNITTRVMNTAERMVKALTIDPIKTGLDEYEIKMNAIQTIQANTRGKNTMEDITAALEDLNAYADKTIYNFAQMTNNVGKFTAQGYDVKEAADAVKGLANLAAASGASAEDMARATYQMSQALGGTIRLMDWNSLRNANMATTELKNTLIALAEVEGINVNDMIEEHGTFEQTLSEGWLSGKMFTEAMNIYSGLYSEAELKAKGFTDAQVKNFIDLAKMAESAATEVKTFTQLWDVLKETAQSGWTQTWEILIGDFETAKKMFTGLQIHFSDIINGWSDARNELLKGWRDAGGRQDMIDSFVNLYEAIVAIIKPIREAFRDIFPPMTVDRLVSLTAGIKDLTAKFKIGGETADKLKRIFRGLFAVVDIAAEFIKAAAKGFAQLLGIVAPAGDGILGFAANIGDALVAFRDWIKAGDVFGKVFSGITVVAKKIAGGFKTIGSTVKTVIENMFGFEFNFGNIADRLKGGVKRLAVVGEWLKTAFVSIGAALKSVWSVIQPVLSKIKDGIVVLAKGIGDVLKNFFTTANFSSVLDLTNAGLLGAILFGVKKFIDSMTKIVKGKGGFIKSIKQFFGDLKDSVTDTLGTVKDSLVTWQNSLKANTLMTIAKAIAILAASLFVLALLDSDKLAVAMAAITTLFIDLFGSMMIFQKVIGPKGVMEFGKISGVMIGVASAVLILSFAMAKLSKLDWNGLAKGLVGVVGLTGTIIGAMALLSLMVKKMTFDKSQNAQMGKLVLQMIGLAIAVRILASACTVMSKLSWEELARGLVGMGAALGAVALALEIMPKSSALSAAGILIAAVGIMALAGALKLLSLLSMDEIGVALVALGGSLAILAAGLFAMSYTGIGSVALLVASVALVAFAGALKVLGLLKWDEIGRGLTVIAGCLTLLAVAMFAMNFVIPGAAALIVAAFALAIIAPVLKILSTLSWGGIAKGLVALAGAFVIMGVAGYALASVVPVILALAAAFLLFGIGFASIAASISLLAVGITLLSAAVTAGAGAIVAGLTIILTGIIQLIPKLATALAQGLIEFLKVLNDAVPVLYETIKVIVLGLLDVLIECIPKIVDGALDLILGLLEALATYTPKIVDYIFDFVVGLIDKFAERIPELVESVVNLFVVFFSSLVDALSAFDTSVLIKALIGMGLVYALLFALGAIASLAPAAMIGVLALGAIVAEIAVVIAAFGLLSKLPGLEWLVNEGGKFLRTIGEAIGGFVGGIADGITSSLPSMANDLSTFMTNLQPFIDGAKTIDSAVMNGVQILADTILTLTGANLLDSLTAWISGGTSLSDFGSQLGQLGTDLNTFATNLGGFDESKLATVTCASTALKTLAQAAEAIPNEGGWAAKLFGENSITAFSDKLPGVALKLNEFATNLGGFDETRLTSVTCAANAIKVLAQAASELPNEGGWAAKIFGDNSIATFGDKLPALGTNMSAFATNLGEFSEANVLSITCAANAIKAMADAASKIDGQAEWAKKLFGDNSLSAFGEELGSLGTNLNLFATNLGTFDEAKVTTVQSAVQAIESFAALADSDLKGAKKNIEGFGDKLTPFAEDLSSFCSAMPDEATMQTATKSLTTLITAIDEISGSSSDSLSKISDALKKLGESGVDSFVKEFTSDSAKADVKSAAQGLVDEAASGIESKQEKIKLSFVKIVAKVAEALKDSYQSFYNAGSYLVSGFAAGISENTFQAEAKAAAMAKAAASAAEEALDINSPSKVFRAIGTAVPEGFAQGIEKLGGMVKASAVSMTDGAKDGVTKAVSDIADLVNTDIDSQPTIRPVLDLTDVRNSAKSIGSLFGNNSVGVMANVSAISSSMNARVQNGNNDDVVSAINKLRAELDGAKGDSYYFGDISYNDDAQVQDAVRTLVRAVKIGGRS